MKCHPANLYFYERLVKLRHEAASKGRLRQERSYSRALQSLRRYPLPLTSTHDAAGLQGVGRIVSSFLEESLQARSASSSEAQDTDGQKELWLSFCRRRLLAALKRGRQNAHQTFPRTRKTRLKSAMEDFQESCKPEKRGKGVPALHLEGHRKCRGVPAEDDAEDDMPLNQLVARPSDVPLCLLEQSSPSRPRKPLVEETATPKRKLNYSPKLAFSEVLTPQSSPSFARGSCPESSSRSRQIRAKPERQRVLRAVASAPADCLIPVAQTTRLLARTISEPLPLPTERSTLAAESMSRQRLADSAQLVLLVDHREVGAGRQHCERGALVAELSSKLGVNSVEARSLPLGDMMWVWQDVTREELVAGWLIERKTFHDLSASITDGRYDEQKSRLLNAPGLDGVIYLVEGSMTLFGVGESSKGGSEATGHKGFGQRLVTPSVPAATLSTTAVHTQLISGFHVIHSASTPHTVSLLVALHGALLEHRQLGMATAEVPCLVPYQVFAELTRKSCQNRLFEAFGRMLRMVPSCGPEATEALIDEFQTPHCFSQALINNSDAELLVRLRARRGNAGRLPVTASTLAMCRSLFAA